MYASLTNFRKSLFPAHTPREQLISVRTCWLSVCVVVATAASASAQDETPLHSKIDHLLTASAAGPVAPLVDDLTYARRLYLDLTGRIPSAAEARAFVSDPDTDRRRKLVDRIQATDEFNRHMATTFDVMLMERRGGTHIKTDAFRAWLQESFRQGKPYSQIAGELIAADTTGETKTAAAFFLEREVEPNLMTREVARMFFGMDLQCAQCHDHPNVDDYKQEDYHGLFAFVGRSSLFRPDKKKPAVISEQADGQAPFKSVFTEREAFTAPRLPGESEFPEPVFEAGDEYQVLPGKAVAGIPKYSRRAKLAELISKGENSYFRRNIANRLWAMVMGRGLVHPVDMHHSGNPPSHPELLQLLADEFAAMNFDVKRFLREIVLSDAYQRSHRPEATRPAPADRLATVIEQLEKQKEAAIAASTKKEEEATEALDLLDVAIAKAEPVRAAWAKARSAATAAAKKHRDASSAQQTKQTSLTSKKTFSDLLSDTLKKVSAASEALGAPQELASIATTLTTKAQKSATESQKLEKELEAAAKATAAAAATLSKAKETEAAELARLTPLRDTATQHRTVMVRALKQSQKVYELVTYADQKTEYLQSLIAHDTLREQTPLLKNQLVDLDQQKNDMAQEAASASQQMDAVKKKMAQAETTRQTTETRLQQLTEKEKRIRQAGDALTEALQKARSAESILANSANTAGITSQLQQSTSRVKGMAGEAQTELEKSRSEMDAISTQISRLQSTVAAAQQTAARAQVRVNELDSQLGELQKQLTSAESQWQETTTEIVEEASRRFQLATVESLTPEQFGWSVLQASGQIGRQIASELAKLNKEKPLTDEQKKDPAALTARQHDAEAAAVATLTKTVTVFVNLFAAQKGQPQDDFFATVDQALFLANGSQIRSWLSPSGDNLTGRLLKMESAEQIADELYLATLVRKPTSEETRDVVEYLKVRGDSKRDAVQELAWALITSAEFRFVY